MPVIIKTSAKLPTPIRKGRGGHFDRLVIELAPVIEKLRPALNSDIRRLANGLNELGCTTSTGKRIGYGNMQRILVRVKEMHLGEGPRTKLQAANGRRARKYALLD